MLDLPLEQQLAPSSNLLQILSCIIYLPGEKLNNKKWVLGKLKILFKKEIASKTLRFPNFSETFK